MLRVSASAPSVILAIVLAATPLACHRGDDAAAATEPAGQLATVQAPSTPVTEQPMPRYLTVTGTLRANEESSVAADAMGRVVQTLVERGQRVKRGQVIVTLDATNAALSETTAVAQSKLAQSQLDQAHRECERVAHLLETGAISQAEFDRQTAQCTAQQWSAAAAQAQQQTATKLLGDARIRAPIDGVVGERLINVGQYVDRSTRVATIYDPDPLRLAVTIPEASLAAVHQDVPVAFTVPAFGDERFEAVVKYISPNVREASRDLVAEAIAPNHEGRLRPGMFAVARIEIGSQPSPVVPATAVVRDETEARVFVVGSDKIVQERLVQLGETKGDLVAIASGVRAGERVVVRPGADLRDGVRAE
jgi:membrane fusion protein, multidrug efflux system